MIVGLASLGVFGVFRSFDTFGGILGGYYTQMAPQATGTYINDTYSPWGTANWGALGWLWAPILVASIAVATVGMLMIRSSRLEKARLGTLLFVAAAVLAFPTVFGFIVGSALLVLGGVLRLIWWPT